MASEFFPDASQEEYCLDAGNFNLDTK